MVIIQQGDVYPSAEVQPSTGVQHFRNNLDDLAGADPYQGSPEGTRKGRPEDFDCSPGGIRQRWKRILHR